MLSKIVKIVRILKRAGFPLYWSRFSRKDYSLHQHIMLIVLVYLVAGSCRNPLEVSTILFFGRVISYPT